MHRCKCGGRAVYDNSQYMCDSFFCDSCDYKTSPYFDGYEYAKDEWDMRQTGRTWKERNKK